MASRQWGTMSMMSTQALLRLSPDEYLRAEAQSEIRHEFVRGKDRKNQARCGEQDWGLAPRDARGGVLVGCAEREENRFRGV
jgi:hypothetical protein